MQKMRLVSEAYKYIKEQDPDTCITKTAFSTLVKLGRIPSIKIGNKTIVNLDHVETFFKDGDKAITAASEALSAYGKIRAIQ
ncbi:MAG: hypothetical protein PHU31_02495 [Anaerotignum sp.]|nr:hypothetical protein [Anaerotignum sp.]